MYLYVAIALLSAALSGWGAWTVQDWRHDSQKLARTEAEIEKAKFDRRASDLAAVGYEKDRGQIRTEFITITERIEHVVKEPFYAGGELCLDADGLRELALATGAAPAASGASGAVPQPRPAR